MSRLDRSNFLLGHFGHTAARRRVGPVLPGGPPYLASYAAAKAGLAGATRNAAHAHRWDRIRINGLDIGWTDPEGEDATQRAFHGAGDDW